MHRMKEFSTADIQITTLVHGQLFLPTMYMIKCQQYIEQLCILWTPSHRNYYISCPALLLNELQIILLPSNIGSFSAASLFGSCCHCCQAAMGFQTTIIETSGQSILQKLQSFRILQNNTNLLQHLNQLGMLYSL